MELGSLGRDALYLLMGSVAALGGETSGIHSAMLVNTGGVQAIQATLDSLPHSKWTDRELMIGYGCCPENKKLLHADSL